MRRACLTGLFLLAAACAEEPDFDTRFEEAEQSIAEKADAIDAELAGEGEETAPASNEQDALPKE